MILSSQAVAAEMSKRKVKHGERDTDSVNASAPAFKGDTSEHEGNVWSWNHLAKREIFPAFVMWEMIQAIDRSPP